MKQESQDKKGDSGGADMGEGGAGEGQAKHVTTVAVEYRRTYMDRPEQWELAAVGVLYPVV